jgi:hypothetical protein
VKHLAQFTEKIGVLQAQLPMAELTLTPYLMRSYDKWTIVFRLRSGKTSVHPYKVTCAVPQSLLYDHGIVASNPDVMTSDLKNVEGRACRLYTYKAFKGEQRGLTTPKMEPLPELLGPDDEVELKHLRIELRPSSEAPEA